jgi:hypothetical protein
MANKLRQRQRQKLKTVQKALLVAGGTSMLAVIAWMTFLTYQADISESRASANRLGMTDPVNNGEIVLAYTWEGTDPLQPEVGPVAKSISKNAAITLGGADSTSGLSAGDKNKGIDLTLSEYDGMNDGGMDISMDFRRLEPNGNFVTRGSSFNFGMQEGKLLIRYKLKALNGRAYNVEETTSYEVPEDTIYRSYRFLYKPTTGRAEILVNNVTVWFNQAVPQSDLAWKTDEKIIIGKEMDGNGSKTAFFDNLIIRKTTSSSKAPMELLAFSAELQGNAVMLNWFTAKEKGTDTFKIERSTDTKVYEEVGTVKAAGASESLKAYALLDTKPVLGVAYYRLGLNNSTVRSNWLPVIAFRIKPEQLSGIGTPSPLQSASEN